MTVALFRSLVPYDRDGLRRDVVAGLTVWGVLVPEALAYASIADISPRKYCTNAAQGSSSPATSVPCAMT